MPSPIESVLLDLSTAFIETDDYNHLPHVYQNILTKYLLFDWLDIFARGPSGTGITISTYPDRPFNGKKYFQKIGSMGGYAEKVLSLPPGKVIIFEELRPCSNEAYDAVHFMGMSMDNGPHECSAIGIYRKDPGNRYTEEEKRFFTRLGPLIRSSVKMMQQRRRLDLMRQGHDRIFEVEKIQPLFVDLQLNILSFPANTKNFLRKALNQPSLGDLPEFAKTWIEKEITPHFLVTGEKGPWQMSAETPSGDILCQASLFLDDHDHPVLILTFKHDEVSVDFRNLSKAGITKREIEVLSYLPLGYTNRQIAMAMDISVSGVKKHLKNLGKKLETSSRSETLYRSLSLKQELS